MFSARKMFNATENFNETELQMWSDFIDAVVREESSISHTILNVAMYITFFASLIGNGLTCIVIYHDKNMHTATNCYLFNLAISDMVVSFAILLEVNEHYISSNKFIHYNFGRAVCKTHFFLVVALWNNGILILTALAVERYVAICYPLMLKTKTVWRRVTKIIMLIWFIAIIETVPELWTVELMTTVKSSVCLTVPTPFARVVNGVMTLVSFVIPLCIMTFVYTMIAYEVSGTQNRSAHDKIFNQRDNRRKVHKLIALTLSFLLCWLPFFAMRMTVSMYDLSQIVKMKVWWRVCYNLSVFNSWFSTVLNPLMFSLMSTKFRKALRSFWRKKIKRQSEITRISKI